MIKHNNPIAEVLNGIVSAAQLAAETGLSMSTCFKVLHDLEASFKDSTVEIVLAWFRENLGPCEESDLFHEDNVTKKGRHPLNGTLTTHQCEMVTCGKCRLETRKSGSHCYNCHATIGA